MRFRTPGIRSSEITPKDRYLNRRRLLAGFVAGAGVARAAEEKITPKRDATTYNNFYELGTDKSDPARNAARLKTSPWKVVVEGMCARPRTFDIDDLRKLGVQEERVYRMRCVEAWSMVIPWNGYPLSTLLKAVEPTSAAKFVSFESLWDRANMFPPQLIGIDLPYREGLRLDEAMHPLTLLAFGMYGETLPNQNGAPVRLVVPWKYGFKGIKSIVKIRLTDKQPSTTWSTMNPREYGFYSNVNPDVDHPRWSQASERRIGEFLKRKTLMFNGYEKEVAHLYAGLDLKKYY